MSSLLLVKRRVVEIMMLNLPIGLTTWSLVLTMIRGRVKLTRAKRLALYLKHRILPTNVKAHSKVGILCALCRMRMDTHVLDSQHIFCTVQRKLISS